MCFHRRVLFRCNHFVWLGISRSCDTEKEFKRGKTDVGCTVMWSHGFDTVRVQLKCPSCTAAEERDGFKLEVLKDRISVLKEYLQRIKGLPEVTEEEWLNPETEPGPTSEDTADDAAAESRSGSSEEPGETADTGNTSIADDEAKDSAPTRQTEVDPRHRPFRLPQRIVERMAQEADERMAAPEV